MKSKYLYDILIIVFLIFILLLVKCFKMERFESIIPKLADNEYPNVNKELKDKYINKYQGDGTYKRFPFKNGSQNILNNKDFGVLKNFRMNNYINTYSDEITYDQMYIICETIMSIKNYKINLDKKKLYINNELNKEYIYQVIYNKLISLINKYFKNYEFETIYNYNDKRQYEIKDTKVIDDNITDNLSEDNRLLIFNISLFKKLKDYYFSLQVSCIYNIIQNFVEFEDISIIGINEDEKIKLDDLYPIEQKHCIMNNNLNNPQLVNCFPQKYSGKQLSLIEYEKKFNNDDVKKFLEEKELEKKKHENYKKFKCHLKDGFSESTCKSYSFKNKTYGVWDKPCENNNECPFYKSNKNYKNNRGGCINGKCEMPKNVKNIAYHYYDTSTKPLCYNCNIDECIGLECYDCCIEQEDRNKYPNLKSPDYIFENDGRVNNLKI